MMNKPMNGGVPASRGAAKFAWKHRGALARGAAVTLVVIVVLQNLEPTKVDFLFWSVAEVPKLVLIAVSAGLGALGHAMVRSWLSIGAGRPNRKTSGH